MGERGRTPFLGPVKIAGERSQAPHSR